MHRSVDFNISHLVRAAAWQRRSMMPVSDDKVFVDSGGTIFYAVDTDIIRLYACPYIDELTPSASPYTPGSTYTQVFPQDNPVLSEAVGRSLTDYIFFRLSCNALIVISHQEVRRVFDAMMVDAHSEQSLAANEIRKVQALVDNINTLDKTSARELAQHAPTILRVLFGQRSHTAALRRFGTLLANGQMVPSANITGPFIRERGWDALQPLADALERFEHLTARVEYSYIRNAWYDRLLSTKSESRRRAALRTADDAQALALLEWINAHLGNRHKLVLLTGDRSIHRAALQYVPSFSDQHFADLFLRHPRAYLAEPGVLSLEGDEPSSSRRESEIVTWLDTFLARFCNTGDAYRDNLDALLALRIGDRGVTKELIERSDIIDEFLNSWQEYTRSLMLAHPPVRPRDILCQSADLQDAASEVRSLISKIRGRLESEVQHAWDSCFAAATTAGYELLVCRPTSSATVPRNPPALLFSSFPMFQSYLADIMRARNVRQNAPLHDPRPLLDIVETFARHVRDEKCGYVYYLGYAVFFCLEQNWRVASILARKALDIALTKKPVNVTGREAAYLEAVSLRHSARRSSDLGAVAGAITQAEQLLADARKNQPTLQAGEVRFPAERCALNLTYRLFEIFQGEKIPTHVPPLSKILISIQDVVDRMCLADSKQCDSESWITFIVERNLLTNYFTTCLLLAKQMETIADKALLHYYYMRLKMNIEESDIPASFLVWATYYAVAWWLSEHKGEKKKMRRLLEEHLSGDAVEVNSVFPYDGERFNFLREVPRTFS